MGGIWCSTSFCKCAEFIWETAQVCGNDMKKSERKIAQFNIYNVKKLIKVAAICLYFTWSHLWQWWPGDGWLRGVGHCDLPHSGWIV